MYFNASKQLASEHPALENPLKRIDNLLYSLNPNAVFSSDTLASKLSEQNARIKNILMLYISAGLLHSDKVFQCAACGVYLEQAPFAQTGSTEISDANCTSCDEQILLNQKKVQVFYFSDQAKDILANSLNSIVNRTSKIMNLKSSNRTVRKFLDDFLKNINELDAFILDNFPDVYKEFSSGMMRTSRVNLLFEKHNSDAVLEALNKHLLADRQSSRATG